MEEFKNYSNEVSEKIFNYTFDARNIMNSDIETERHWPHSIRDFDILVQENYLESKTSPIEILVIHSFAKISLSSEYHFS